MRISQKLNNALPAEQVRAIRITPVPIQDPALRSYLPINTYAMRCPLTTANILVISSTTPDLAHLSADNPAFELFKNELNADPVRMSKVLNIVNDLVGKTKAAIQAAEHAGKKISPGEQLTIFYALLREELQVIQPTEGVELVSDGLLSTPPRIDCDTGCALFMFAAHELKWPLSVMSCTGLTDTDNAHTFLKWTGANGHSFYYETTSGFAMEDYTGIPSYKQQYRSITEITSKTFFANFCLIAADQRSYDKDPSAKISLYTKAIEHGATLLPKQSQYYNRGNAYLALEKYQEAIGDYSLALRSGAPVARIYYNRAVAYLQLSDLDKSLPDLSQALLLDPEHAEARYNRAVLYYQKKLYAQALLDAEWVCRKDPGDSDAAELYRQIKRRLSAPDTK